MGKDAPDRPNSSRYSDRDEDKELTNYNFRAGRLDDLVLKEPTIDKLSEYRAGDIENAAAKVERGDGSARSNMMGALSLAKEQGVLDLALNKLEKEGKASIVRDKDGLVKEIVIDPATGLFDRGIKTVIDLKGPVKVDGRSESIAASEKRDAALRAAESSVKNSYLTKGERALTPEEKQTTRDMNRAMINGDSEALSNIAKELLSDPESARRVITEVEKTMSYCVSFVKGEDGQEHLRILGGSENLLINGNGELSSENFSKVSREKQDVEKTLKGVSQWSIYTVNELYDRANEFDGKRQGAVTSPEERAKSYNMHIQRLIDEGQR